MSDIEEVATYEDPAHLWMTCGQDTAPRCRLRLAMHWADCGFTLDGAVACLRALGSGRGAGRHAIFLDTARLVFDPRREKRMEAVSLSQAPAYEEDAGQLLLRTWHSEGRLIVSARIRELVRGSSAEVVAFDLDQALVLAVDGFEPKEDRA